MNPEDINNSAGPGTIQKLTRLLAAPTIEPGQRAARIQTVETDIVLPLRVLIIIILSYFFFFSGWFYTAGSGTGTILHPHIPHAITNAAGRTGQTNQAAGTAAGNLVTQEFDWSLRHQDTLKTCFVIYAFLNVVFGATLIAWPHLTLVRIESMMFAMGLLDATLMGTLTLLSKGFDSQLYWVFPVMILHNALALPVALPQLLLNFLVTAAFMIGGFSADRGSPEIDPRLESPVERLIVLVAWALCCYGIQVLFEKQNRAEAEATEFAVRQERLKTAGRLAAEIAHQIKNPLGIITNAAFSLQRAVSEGELAVDEQVGIIREEVERADQIITELMGYAQLAEGRVERLEVAEELDNAIHQVFPPAAKYQVEVVKNYDPDLPALFMQRRHLATVMVNLLQNAREAMNGVGRIEVTARHGENESVVISIVDNGPGIPPDKIGKIFEAYFTTREKGTGLGLAIVKHNTEMYGGNVSVETQLGQGTRFTLDLPARILMRLSK